MMISTSFLSITWYKEVNLLLLITDNSLKMLNYTDPLLPKALPLLQKSNMMSTTNSVPTSSPRTKYFSSLRPCWKETSRKSFICQGSLLKILSKAISTISVRSSSMIFLAHWTPIKTEKSMLSKCSNCYSVRKKQPNSYWKHSNHRTRVSRILNL